MADAVSDREFVDRCIRGETQAWEDLVRLHVDLLHFSVRRVLERTCGASLEGDVQDVLQGVFLKLWEDERRRLRSWKGRSRLSTWLVAVARRQALDFLERRARASRAPHALNSDNGSGPTLPGDAVPSTLLTDLESAETADQIQEALSRLSPRDRLLVRLIYFDEASYKDAARLLDVPLNSVSPSLGRAKRRLAELLSGNGSP